MSWCSRYIGRRSAKEKPSHCESIHAWPQMRHADAVEDCPRNSIGNKTLSSTPHSSSSGATDLIWKIKTCGGCRESTGVWVLEKSQA